MWTDQQFLYSKMKYIWKQNVKQLGGRIFYTSTICSPKIRCVWFGLGIWQWICSYFWLVQCFWSSRKGIEKYRVKIFLKHYWSFFRFLKFSAISLFTILIASWTISIYLTFSYNYTHQVGGALKGFNILHGTPWQRFGPFFMGSLLF